MIIAEFGRVLVVTAVGAERDAIMASGVEAPDVVAFGVGAVAAAAGTARLLTLAECAGAGYDAVLSAGVAGGFVGRAGVGDLVIASESIAADAGAHAPDGFHSFEDLGLATVRIATDSRLRDLLRGTCPQAIVGPVVTVTATTGTAEGTTAMMERHPEAVAEAMEGYGVAVAAQAAGVAFGEIRAVSNPVGPRDRSSWRIPLALRSLTEAFVALCQS